MSQEIVPVTTLSLPTTVAEAVAHWRQYQELTRQLLDDSDYQKIGAKRFKKKSAWRKYAKAFNISDRVTSEQIERFEDGFPIFARIRVEAYHLTTDRRSEADHECHVTERCCPTTLGMKCPKAKWSNHDCCIPNCSGRQHWSHPGDLPATALTRAKNRAIADLIGAGEVSAEEMVGQRPQEGFETEEDTTEPHQTPQEGQGRAATPKVRKSPLPPKEDDTAAHLKRPPLTNIPLNTVGAFLTLCWKDLGLNSGQVLAALGVPNLDGIKDLDDAYHRLRQIYSQ